MDEQKNVLAPVHRRKRIAAILSLFSWIVLALGIGVLFWAQWQQIYYWDYTPFLWGLQAGFYIVVGTIGAFIVSLLLFGRVWWHWYLDVPVRRFSTAFTGLALILMMGGSCVAWVYAGRGIANTFYDAGPYLTWSTNQDPTNSITICWYSAVDAASIVHYGTAVDNMTLQANNTEWGQNHKVAVTGLQPDTTYYYQVGVFPLKQFQTAPHGTFNYSVDVWADPRTNEGGIDDPNIMNDQPNLPLKMANDSMNSGTPIAFALFCGDEVDNGPDYSSWRLWLNDITTMDFASNRTIEIAPGNHERHEDPTGRNFRNFMPYVQDSLGAFYYSFDYGNVHYTMIDPLNPLYTGVGSNWWAMTTQEQTWLENDLKTHQTETFRVVCVHPSAYNNGQPTSNDGFDGDIYDNLAPLAAQYNVSVVFSGHIHHYEVDNKTGTLWMCIGIGGNTDHNLSNSGYVQMDVSATQLTLRSRYTNGTLFDYNQILA